MVVRQSSKLVTRVRFPPPAPVAPFLRLWLKCQREGLSWEDRTSATRCVRFFPKRINRNVGRVVYCTAFEKRRTPLIRGSEGSNPSHSTMEITDKDRKLLKKAGWQIDCELPFELSYPDGSIATLEAANFIVRALRNQEAQEKTFDLQNI